MQVSVRISTRRSVDVFLLFNAFPLKKEHEFGFRNSDKYRIPTFKVWKTNISMQYSFEFRTIYMFARRLIPLFLLKYLSVFWSVYASICSCCQELFHFVSFLSVFLFLLVGEHSLLNSYLSICLSRLTILCSLVSNILVDTFRSVSFDYMVLALIGSAHIKSFVCGECSMADCAACIPAHFPIDGTQRFHLHENTG